MSQTGIWEGTCWWSSDIEKKGGQEMKRRGAYRAVVALMVNKTWVAAAGLLRDFG